MAQPSLLVGWTEDQLESGRRVALERFIDQRMQAADPDYMRHFESCRGQVAELFGATDDLATFDAGSLGSARLIDAARFLAVPPWSEDDLDTVARENVSKRKRVPPALAQTAVGILRVGWDPHRFPWLAGGRRPTEQEREAAVRWTASIWALERLRTERRMTGSQAQQAAVEAILTGLGYERAPLKAIPFPHSLPAGKFAAKVALAGHECDVAVRLRDERLLAIECKVSNSSLNSIKRLIHEAGNKAKSWRQSFGEVVVPAVVLSGVYKLKHLLKAQNAHGVTVFWEHDLAALERALEER